MWKSLGSYLWWTHRRGSLQYDVMVTLILAFIFISPHFINYRDKPALNNSHPIHAGGGLDSYLLPANGASLSGSSPDTAALTSALPPAARSARIDHVEMLKDANGNIAAYRVWVKP